MGSFNAEFNIGQSLTASFDSSVAIVTDPYTGSYSVIPTFEDQILPTMNKNMLGDVVVHEIPVTYTTNPSDGITVLIG